MLRRARSLTLLVCVAEKHSVCRFLGRFSRMAVNVALNPRSSMRSASV